VTLDGRTLEFRVAQVDSAGLIGRPGRVEFDEIAVVQVRTASVSTRVGSAIGAVLGVSLGLLMLGLIYWAVSGYWAD
jgi:ABC-type glucose/galactose transport system permease subunit